MAINPKKIAAIAVGVKPAPADDAVDDEDATDGGADEDTEGGDAAAEELGKAVSGGDAAAIRSAFETLAETCYPGLAKLK